jgi:gluconolactonase
MIERLDAAVNELVPDEPLLERIATGFTWTEGPIWLPSGRLLFADIPSNSIRRWGPGDGDTIFMQPSGYLGKAAFGGREPGSNGMTLDPAGRLTVCGHGQRNVYRLEEVDAHAQKTVLAETYEGKRLNSPNDLVYKADGSLYFTDPPYGLPMQSDADPTKELKFSGVYRMPGAAAQKAGTRPPSEQLQLLTTELPRPNGLAFSPDEKYLYVDNSEPEMLWMRYTVNPDGTLRDGKVFFHAGTYAQRGAPDGMKLDVRGNLYTSGPGGVILLTPEGKHIGTIAVPEVVANLAWGGDDYRTLFIAASTSVYCMQMKVPGDPPHGLVSNSRPA